MEDVPLLYAFRNLSCFFRQICTLLLLMTLSATLLAQSPTSATDAETLESLAPEAIPDLPTTIQEKRSFYPALSQTEYKGFTKDLRYGLKMLNRNHPELAKVTFVQMLRKAPNNAEVLFLAGMAWLSCEEPKRAAHCFEHVATYEPRYHEELFHSLGIAYHELGEYELAIKCYRRFLSLYHIPPSDFRHDVIKQRIRESKEAWAKERFPEHYAEKTDDKHAHTTAVER